MKARWTRLAKRIDAMSLRERVILFLSLALVMAAVADSLVISPALDEQKALSAQLKKQAAELQDTPQGRLQREVARLHARQKALDSEIKRRLSSPDELARLPDLLEQTLRRHARLSLVKLATREDAPTSATRALRWQGVDLSVAGHYIDLMNYLSELENALPGLR